MGVLETEDTSVKQADPTQGQDPASVQTQNIEENEVPDAEGTSDMQVQDGNTDSQVNGEQPDPDIPDDQTLRASQVIIIKLPSTMQAGQYNTIW